MTEREETYLELLARGVRALTALIQAIHEEASSEAALAASAD